MIKYKQAILPNGLTILVNRDHASKFAAVNILYKVGARNESEDKTGFAHLFEHLMFRGTCNVPDFDIRCRWPVARTTPSPPMTHKLLHYPA